MITVERQSGPTNLFDLIPLTLFQPLAVPSRRIYAAVLLRLYELAQGAAFIQEEVAVEAVMEVLANISQEEQVELAQDEAVQLELQMEMQLQDEGNEYGGLKNIYRQHRAQSRVILRRLVATEWLKDEQQPDLSLHYTLLDHAFPILDGFQRAIERRPTEFEGLIYSTYQLLKQPDPHVSGYVVLQQVYDQARRMMTGLKQLQHNIGSYIQQLTNAMPVAEVLNNFASYRTEVSPNYHRLKTADHVSRYRLDIQQSIDGMVQSNTWLDAAIVEARRRRPDLPVLEAEREIYGQLVYIQRQFEQMDTVMSAIDERHSRYAEAAVVQVKYGVGGGQDLTSRLIKLCHQLREIPGSVHRGVPEPLVSLFRLFEVSFLNRRSLYSPRQTRQTHQPLPLATTWLDPSAHRDIYEQLTHEMESLITPRRVWTYLAPHLQDQEIIETCSLPLETLDDWLMLIGLQVYSDVLQEHYHILSPPPARPWVETTRFCCPNLRFEKVGRTNVA
jgi:hypothetical protein